MFVGKRMIREVVTVTPEDTLEHAARLLALHRVHQLPVVRGEELAGIVSGTDIRNATFREGPAGLVTDAAAGHRKVEEVMTRKVICVNPWDTVEDALVILHRKRLGALPVVKGKYLVGILTKADVLAALVETLDIEGIGVRIEVLLPREIDAAERLLGLVRSMEIEIRSLVLSSHGGRFVAFLRLATIDVASVKAAFRDAGFTVAELQDFLD